MKLRRALTLGAAATLATAAAVAVSVATSTSPASSHGAMVFPITRTYACYLDGLAGGGGDINPTNPACVEAVRIGGKQPFWDWYGVLQSFAAGNHRTIIPDGQLCGGGSAKYAGLNQARNDWPLTQLTPGATVTLRYNGWAPHPGTWSQYVTKDGFDINQPLKWSDLEEVPFNQVTNPPLGSGSSGAEYSWQATLPNKSGRHIIYSIWQRSDSPEAFYNCSDVQFGPGGPTTPPTTRPTTPPTTRVTTPPTTRATTPPTVPSTIRDTTPPTSVNPRAGCIVSYKQVSAWNNGFQGEVTVTNNSSASINGWTVTWTYPSGQTVSQLWSGTLGSPGPNVSVKNVSWNGSLAVGQSTTFGFLGSISGGTPAAPATLSCTTP